MEEHNSPPCCKQLNEKPITIETVSEKIILKIILITKK
jgi:hypothetical protein